MEQQTGPFRSWVAPCIGVLAAGVGLLPWLTTGGRALLQNLWATTTPSDQMPFILLPFSQYQVTEQIAVLVVGAALGGLVGRALRERLGRRGTAALVATVLVLQLIALGQTTLEIHAGLEDSPAAVIYLGTLVAVAGLALLVGVVAACLLVAGPRATAVVGASVGALALGPWLAGPWIMMDQPLEWAAPALRLAARWVPPVLVGLAVAWAGLRSVARLVAACAALVLLWIVPALTTAIQFTLGSRALLRELDSVVSTFVRTLVQAATGPLPELLPPLGVAVVVAAAGPAVLARFRGRSAAASPGSHGVG